MNPAQRRPRSTGISDLLLTPGDTYRAICSVMISPNPGPDGLLPLARPSTGCAGSVPQVEPGMHGWAHEDPANHSCPLAARTLQPPLEASNHITSRAGPSPRIRSRHPATGSSFAHPRQGTYLSRSFLLLGPAEFPFVCDAMQVAVVGFPLLTFVAPCLLRDSAPWGTGRHFPGGATGNLLASPVTKRPLLWPPRARFLSAV